METARGVGESFFSNSEEKSAREVTSPGILVYSHTMQLLHVNRRALELTGGISRTENGSVRVVLSTPVIELRAEVRATLDSRVVANVWEPFEMKRFVVEPGRKLLLRGFGLPDRNASEHSHIVILLEDAGLQQADRTQQVPPPVQPADMKRAVA